MKLSIALGAGFALGLLAGWSPGADSDTVREGLNSAKTAFNKEITKYDRAVADYFEKREGTARNEANKKLVAQIKVEQSAFMSSGDIPQSAPLALRKMGADAQKNLETAFQAGAGEYFKAKKDREAEESEKELLAILLKTKRATYLADLVPIKVTSIKEVDIGRHPVAIKGTDFDEAVIMHPGDRKSSEGVYKLNRGYSRLVGKVAVKQPPGDDQKGPKTAPTFEILTDGKSRWKSKPVAVYDEVHEFSISTSGTDTLLLRVHCPGDHTGCHAYWLDTVLVR